MNADSNNKIKLGRSGVGEYSGKISPIAQDEIDILELLVKIIGIIKRRAKSIILIGGLSFFVGITSFFFISSKAFYSSLVLFSHEIKLSEASLLIDNLSQYLEEDDKRKVANLLEMSTESVGELKSIEISKLEDNQIGNGAIYIRAEVGSNEILPELQKGIIHYFDSNPFLSRRQELDKKRLLTNISDIETELSRLDSIQMTLEQILKSSSQSKNGANIFIDNYTLISKQILALKDKKGSLEEKLNENFKIEIIQPFQAYSKPQGKSFFYFLGICLGIGLVICIVWITLTEVNSLVKQKKQELSQ
ncbi:hypothetical protein [Xanthovirga aplysinae]|uniref:hypothetical protein n=1 Tax=Xanthovirga aplysinae TaxID=2529853 RepID=UPI0012BBEC52|nr:hypothetical protein [Xanthovirga aplysinae]MTI31979.1 hypothetical protein [Xanthovirga aplysinae]